MYIIKVLGACLLIISSSLYGFSLGRSYLKRIEHIRELKKIIAILDGELRYNNTPIRLAFEKIANRSKNIYSNLFLCISIKMEEDASINLGAAWEYAINECIEDKFDLKENDLKKLIDFGNAMESLDKESRNSVFEGYMYELDMDIKEACEEKDNKVKLYRTMGVMSGLFIAILIV